MPKRIAASVDAALALLDKTFLDADEYGSALVALEKLKMTSENQRMVSHSNIHYCSCYAQSGLISEMMFYLHKVLSAFYRPIFSQHRIFRNLYLSALTCLISQQSGKC